MTPIGQILRVSERNTEKETGMWLLQNRQFLQEREKEAFMKLWDMCVRGKSFTEAYESLLNAPFESQTSQISSSIDEEPQQL